MLLGEGTLFVLFVLCSIFAVVAVVSFGLVWWIEMGPRLYVKKKVYKVLAAVLWAMHDLLLRTRLSTPGRGILFSLYRIAARCEVRSVVG